MMSRGCTGFFSSREQSIRAKLGKTRHSHRRTAALERPDGAANQRPTKRAGKWMPVRPDGGTRIGWCGIIPAVGCVAQALPSFIECHLLLTQLEAPWVVFKEAFYCFTVLFFYIFLSLILWFNPVLTAPFRRQPVARFVCRMLDVSDPQCGGRYSERTMVMFFLSVSLLLWDAELFRSCRCGFPESGRISGRNCLRIRRMLFGAVRLLWRFVFFITAVWILILILGLSRGAQSVPVTWLRPFFSLVSLCSVFFSIPPPSFSLSLSHSHSFGRSFLWPPSLDCVRRRRRLVNDRFLFFMFRNIILSLLRRPSVCAAGGSGRSTSNAI